MMTVAGCGDGRLSTVPVRGIVQFENGAPVRVGTIEFSSEEHDVTATGKIQTDGTFTLGTYEPSDGAVKGLHRVIVMQMVINDGTIDHTLDHGKPVDPKYASYSTSRLRTAVSGHPDQVVEITVSPAPKN